MSHHRTTPSRNAMVWGGILLAGLLAGWIGYRSRLNDLRDNLLRDARRLAVAFDAPELRALTGAAADHGTPAHAAAALRLQKLRSVYPEARYIGVYRWHANADRAVPLVDSAAGAAWDWPDDFLEAERASRVRDAVRLGEPTTEPLRRDGSGRWVLAYARLAPAESGRGQDILVLDVNASRWPGAAWETAFQAAFYTWVLCGLPFLAFLVARRQGEQREVIRNLSEAMEQSHSAIMIVDLDGVVEYANRGLCQQLGYARRELLGRSWRELGLAPAPDTTHAEVMAVVRSGRPWEGEWCNQRKDGSTYPVRGVVTPVRNRDGSLACHVVVLDDVTETKRKEAELREARDRAEAGDRAKGHFLATMSHEVRTPLNGIVGFTSLLLETPLSAEQRDYVQTIRMSTEALIQLTGDILDFARIESGKLKLEPLPCDPRECVEDALDLLAAKAAEKQIELLHHAGPELPAAVLTDGGRLRQVLVNLVGNAVKFTEKGEVTVGVRLLPPDHPEAAAAINARGPQEGVLEFSVHDTGIGIDPTQHPMLFKPFSQVDDSTTRRYSGTGLGLAISRNLVRLMGGEISVTSQPGRGSVFRFTISAPVAAPDPPTRDLAGLRVALVARPGALRGELACLLAGWSAQVTEVAATEELGNQPWQAAVIDLGEPLARTLAATREPIAGVPPERAIALVPVTLSSELRGALRAHFRSLLNKPVHHESLFSLLTGAHSEGPFVAVPPTHFGFRVLLAEDNPIEQRTAQRVLANLGCSWNTVENGRAALAELTRRPGDYDLVLLDLQFPDMDGLAALTSIRDGEAGSRAQTMWIIALVADAEEEQRARAQSAGLNDYLISPVSIGDVEAAFKRFRVERASRRR